MINMFIGCHKFKNSANFDRLDQSNLPEEEEE